MKQLITGAASKIVPAHKAATTLVEVAAAAREDYRTNLTEALAGAVGVAEGAISVSHQTSTFGDPYAPNVIVSVIVSGEVVIEVPSEVPSSTPMYAGV